MNVVFGIWADRAAYPAHGGVGAGASGAPVVGPLGFLDLLETALGLAGPPNSQVVRIAAWQRRLEAADDGARFWTASLAADPWATSRQILVWRDALIEAGWNSKLKGSKRLEDIGAAEAIDFILVPGPSDRLAAAYASLDGRAASTIQRSRLIDSRTSLSPGWRRLIDRLEALGVTIENVLPSAAADTTTALGRAQSWITRGAYEAVGTDSTLVEILADTPIMAAEALASWLSARPQEAESMVLIAQDGDSQLLDGVLARHAQPRVGFSPRSSFRGVLQVLPLAFQLAWPPFDAQALLDLLLLPRPPLPRNVAGKIASVLADSPGLDGPKWRQAWFEIEAIAFEGAESAAEKQAATVKLDRWRAWVRPSPLDANDGLSVESVLAICAELSLNLGDGSDHAACCAGVSMICTPSRNLAPWTTLGKRFSPFSFRHVLAAAATNLNTISLAVFGESAPFVRTVR